MLQRHRIFIAAMVLSGLAAGWGAAVLTPPTYKAAALVEQLPTATSADAKTETLSLATALTRPELMATVAHQLGLGPRTYAMNRRLGVAAVRDTRIVSVSFSAPDAGFAVQVVNGIVAAEIASEQRQERELQTQRLTFLERQTQAANTATVNDAAAMARQADLAGQVVVATQRRQQLEAAETAADIASARPAAPVPVAPDTSLRRAEMAAEVSRLAQQYQPGAAPLQQAQQALAALDASLQMSQARATSDADHQLDQTRQQVAVLRTEAAAEGARVEELTRAADDAETSVQSVAADRKAHADLLTQAAEARAALGSETPQARLLQSAALVPPMWPRPWPQLCGGLLLGFGIGLGTAWFLEERDDRMHLPEAGELGVPVLGLLPPHRRWSPGDARPREFQCAIDHILPPLLRARHQDDAQVLLVAGARNQADVTLAASQLACELALTAKAVLLVDGGRERSAIPGLTEVLTQNRPLKDTVQSWPAAPGLAVSYLAAGEGAGLPPATAPCIASEAMHELMAAARAGYDWVLIEAGAALECAHARLWAEHADAALVVADVTKPGRRETRLAMDMFEMDGLPVLGLVLTHVGAASAVTAPQFARKPPETEKRALSMRAEA